MDFISTRGGSAVSAGTAILKGIAEDGGLFVPSFFPTLSQEDLRNMVTMDYAERAALVLGMFLSDYSEAELLSYARKAYARFDGEPAPVIGVDDTTYIMELFHGPTLAFKDIALTLLPHLMGAAHKKCGSDKKTLILVATSGDTGKAAIEGFKNVEGTEIVVIYPSEGVSALQKLQMQTSDGDNVHVLGIKGNFDDAQSAVKRIFNSPECKERFEKLGYALSSANSINWGRLVPQIVYYISAYVDMLGCDEIEEGEPINFVVPTGNFGDVLAGYYAKRMGLPVNKLIVASNINNVLTDFFGSGRYDINRPFHKTMSPSMDILISSNLERLLFEILDRDSAKVRALMDSLKEDGEYEIDVDTLFEKVPEFLAYCSDEAGTEATIDNFFETNDYLLDPHTAVAVNSYNDYLTETGDQTKTVVVSTASPYKFAHDVYQAVSGNDEEDPFKAVKKLHSYTLTDIPKEIKALEYLEPIHTDVVAVKDIDEAIFAYFEKE